MTNGKIGFQRHFSPKSLFWRELNHDHNIDIGTASSIGLVLIHQWLQEPETLPIDLRAEKMAHDLGATVKELMHSDELIKKLDSRKYTSEAVQAAQEPERGVRALFFCFGN